MNEKLGKYELVRQIGTGSFGLVYEAFDPHLKRSVAIKVCTAREEQARLRFHREAEIAGNLIHPNLTTVHDFGFHADVPYLVEEYLDGEDLGSRLQRTSPAFSQQLDYLIQLAHGLAYAHDEGVVHRDVKPSNLRILHDDSLKILDFGMAKRTDAESKLTRTGSTVGTAAYLSPELLHGEEASAASDIFSFGVVAYQLFTGQRPFAATSIAEVLAQILHEEPVPVERVWRSSPPKLAHLIHRCLAKRPADRFADCRTIAEELESIVLETLGSGSVPDGCRAETAPPRNLHPGVFQETLVERGQDLLRGGDRALALAVLSSAKGVGQGSPRLERLLAKARGGLETPAPPASAVPAPETASLDEARAELRALLYVGSFDEVGSVLRRHRGTLGHPSALPSLRTELRIRLAAAHRTLGARAAHLVSDTTQTARGRWQRQDLLGARRLLQAVTPLDSSAGESHQVLHLVAATARSDPGSRQAEIFGSLEGLLARKRYADAGEALRFARSLGVPKTQIDLLRRRLTRAFRDELEELSGRWRRAREELARRAPARAGEDAESLRLLKRAREEAADGRRLEALQTLLEAAKIDPERDEVREALRAATERL